jgi:hypothetical protein
VSVTVCAALVAPTAVAPNAIAPTGDNETPGGATPIPLSATLCVRNWSVTTSTPLPAPTLFGTNVTIIAQLACAFNELPHPFTTTKSPAVICAPTNVNATSPAFVSVMFCATLAVFNCCAAKLRLCALNPSVAGEVPVPCNAVVWVPTASTTVNIPLRTPDVVGTNAIATVQPTPAASVLAHVFAAITKSPLTEIIPSALATPPLFEIVTFCAPLLAPTVVPVN